MKQSRQQTPSSPNPHRGSIASERSQTVLEERSVETTFISFSTLGSMLFSLSAIEISLRVSSFPESQQLATFVAIDDLFVIVERAFEFLELREHQRSGGAGFDASRRFTVFATVASHRFVSARHLMDCTEGAGRYAGPAFDTFIPVESDQACILIFDDGISDTFFCAGGILTMAALRSHRTARGLSLQTIDSTHSYP
jgi:hypothetical protein